MLLLPAERTAIECTDPATYLLPSNLIHLTLALILQILEERLVVADRIDGISQSVNIPVVNLDTVVKDLSTA
jgi:hypothetical protein